MCEPATLATIALVSSAASTATGVVGSLQAGKAQSASARYQGQLADINAEYADRAARDALDRGEFDALAHGRKVAQLRGKQTRDMAANGLELGYGTPLDIATDTDVLAAEDNSRIFANAMRESEGYRINAQGYRNEGAGARAAGANARTASYINAGSTLLDGASSLAGTWTKYKGGYKAPAPRIFG